MSIVQVLDRMLEYVCAKSDSICGDVVARLLFSCFCLGHVTSLDPSVYKTAADILAQVRYLVLD